MRSPRQRVPELVVQRAAALAEAATGLPAGSARSPGIPGARNAPGLSDPAMPARKLFRALLGDCFHQHDAARAAGCSAPSISRDHVWAMARPDFADLSARLYAATLRDGPTSTPYKPTQVPDSGQYQQTAAEVCACSVESVGMALTAALRKLQAGVVRIEKATGASRACIGEGLYRAMRSRTLAASLIDIADCAGVDPMVVARAYVAEFKKGKSR